MYSYRYGCTSECAKRIVPDELESPKLFEGSRSFWLRLLQFFPARQDSVCQLAGRRADPRCEPAYRGALRLAHLRL